MYFWTYLLFGKAQNQSSHGLTGQTTDYSLAIIIVFNFSGEYSIPLTKAAKYKKSSYFY